jgi:uncharacterized protein HemY
VSRRASTYPFRRVESSNLSFYETAAQILPLLYLALLFQVGIFRPRPRVEERGYIRKALGSRLVRTPYWVLVVTVIVILIIGEIVALHV